MHRITATHEDDGPRHGASQNYRGHNVMHTKTKNNTEPPQT